MKIDPELREVRFKAKWCTRGFLQHEEIDYTETFVPVVRYDSLCIFLAMVAQIDLGRHRKFLKGSTLWQKN